MATAAFAFSSYRSASFLTCDDRIQIDPAMISIPDQRINARLVTLILKLNMEAFPGILKIAPLRPAWKLRQEPCAVSR